MLKDIVAVEPLADHRLRLRFEDGAEGVVALPDLVPFEGVFDPLRDPEVFRQVRVNADLGCIEWPSGADLDGDVLYARITGAKLPEFALEHMASTR
ncbi:molybdopterin-guanine dinucleotide biosynthesis protein A [Candidatus Poribacteria bacterium]|nr:molybdopterin-guanine dinucleotide biosynthesis protein A [Candidatus Poribacteria bacterium]